MKNAPFKSGFAILDTQSGRAALAKRVTAGEKVHVRVDLMLDTRHSRDDGISIEFSGAVLSLKEFKKPARLPKRRGRRC